MDAADQGRGHCPRNHHHHHDRIDHQQQQPTKTTIIQWMMSFFYLVIPFNHRRWFSSPTFHLVGAYSHRRPSSSSSSSSSSSLSWSSKFVHFIILVFHPYHHLFNFLLFLLFVIHNPNGIAHCYETYDEIDQIAEESSSSMVRSMAAPFHHEPEPLVMDPNADHNPKHGKTGHPSVAKAPDSDVDGGGSNHPNPAEEPRFSCLNSTEGYFPDRKFCDIFHYCKNDKTRYTFVCPQGSFYNPGLTICEQSPSEDSTNLEKCRAPSFVLESYQNDGQVFVGSDEDRSDEYNGESNLKVDFSDPPSSTSANSPMATTTASTLSSENHAKRKLHESKLNALISKALIPQSTGGKVADVPIVVASKLPPSPSPREYDLFHINHVVQSPHQPRPPSTTPSSLIHQNGRHSINQLNSFNNKIKYGPQINNKGTAKNKSKQTNQTNMATTTIGPLVNVLSKQTNQSTNVLHYNNDNFINDYDGNLRKLPMEHRDEIPDKDMERFFKILDMSNFDLSNSLSQPLDRWKAPLFVDNVPVPIKSPLIPNYPTEMANNHGNSKKIVLPVQKFFKESLPFSYWRSMPKFLKSLNSITITTTTNTVNNRGNNGRKRHATIADYNRGARFERRFPRNATTNTIRTKSSTPNIHKLDSIQLNQGRFGGGGGGGGGEIMDHDHENYIMLDQSFAQQSIRDNNNDRETLNQISYTFPSNGQMANDASVVGGKNNSHQEHVVEMIDAHGGGGNGDGNDKISMLSIPVLVPTNLTQNDYHKSLSGSVLRPIVIPLKEKGKLVPAYVLQFSHNHNRFKRSLNNANNNNNNNYKDIGMTSGGNKILSNIITTTATTSAAAAAAAAINSNNNDINNNNNNGKRLLHFPIKSNLLVNLIPSIFKSKLIKGSKTIKSPQQTQQLEPSQSIKLANGKALNSMLMFGSAGNPVPMYYQKYSNNDEALFSYMNQLAANENNQIYDLKDFSNQFLSPYHFTSIAGDQSSSQPQRHKSYNNNKQLHPKPSSLSPMFPLQSYEMLNVQQKHIRNQNLNHNNSLIKSIPHSGGNLMTLPSSFSFPRETSYSESMVKSKPSIELAKNRNKPGVLNNDNSAPKTLISSNANVYVPDEVFEDYKVVEKMTTNPTPTITVVPPKLSTSPHRPRSTEPKTSGSESKVSHAETMDAWNRYNKGRSLSSTKPTSESTIANDSVKGNLDKGFEPNLKNMIIINYANGTTLRIAAKKNLDLIHNNHLNDGGQNRSMSSMVTASMMVAPPLPPPPPPLPLVQNRGTITTTTTMSTRSALYDNDDTNYETESPFETVDQPSPSSESSEEASSAESSPLPLSSMKGLVDYFQVPIIFEMVSASQERE